MSSIQKSSIQHSGTCRKGITVIEVLTSMIVALIGVLGVMIMIPFAIQQSTSGLDRDAATAMARSVYSDFETRGYRSVNRVEISPGVNVRELNWTVDGINRVRAGEPEIFCIDPLGITENLLAANVSFPFNASPNLPDGTGAFPNAGDLSFASANLWTPTGPMDLAMARQMFRGQDELVLGEPLATPLSPDADLNGPEQIYDSGPSGILRRQYFGSLSWCAIVVPVKDDYASVPAAQTGAWKYRMYILVFKDRPALLDPVGKGVMFTSPLEPAANIGLASPLSTVYLTAGTLVEDTPLRKGNWVMLINRRETDDTVAGYPAGETPAELGFEKQVAFARVINYSNQTGATLPSLTLEGPDFDFGDLSNALNITSQTHIVHLRNVIAVYERTFVLEGESNWNISF